MAAMKAELEEGDPGGHDPKTGPKRRTRTKCI